MPGHDYGAPVYEGLALLFCPPYESALANMDFSAAVTDSHETGADPDGWVLDDGDFGERLLTGGFHGSGFYRLSPPETTAGNHVLRQSIAAARFAEVFGQLQPGTDYFAYGFARAAGGDGTLTVAMTFIDADDAPVATGSVDFELGEVGPGSLPFGPAWRVLRGKIGRFTAAQCAAIVRADITWALTPPGGVHGADTTVDLDWLAFGVPLDSNFLGRCACTDPFEADRETEWEDQPAPGDLGFRHLANAGFQVGVWAVQGIQPGGEAEPRNFLRAAGGDRTISVMYDLTNLTRDYYPLAVLLAEDDGLEQGIGAFSDVALPWRETV